MLNTDVSLAIIESNLPPKENWYCVDCNKNTFNDSKDYYIVTNELWYKYGVLHKMLCVTCFEKRLGRTLEKKDLVNTPLNSEFNYYTKQILNS